MGFLKKEHEFLSEIGLSAENLRFYVGGTWKAHGPVTYSVNPANSQVYVSSRYLIILRLSMYISCPPHLHLLHEEEPKQRERAIKRRQDDFILYLQIQNPGQHQEEGLPADRHVPFLDHFMSRNFNLYLSMQGCSERSQFRSELKNFKVAQTIARSRAS